MNARKAALKKLTEERTAAVPALEEFATAVDARLGASFDAFRECARDFDRLVASPFLTELVNYELEKFQGDPLYVPLMSFSSQVVILESEFFQLNVGFVNRKTTPYSGRVESLPNHCMLVIIDDTPMEVARYEQPAAFPTDSFRRDAPLERRESGVWRPREVAHLRAGRDIMEFKPARDETSVVLNFSSSPFLDFVWEYDCDSLLPVRFVPGNATWSRIDYAAQIMAMMKDRAYLETLEKLANHPAHFLRWRAIRSVIELDFASGLRLLREAASDAHPHVRAAAAATLSTFENTSVA